eukprot:tig00020675_g12579.t1
MPRPATAPLSRPDLPPGRTGRARFPFLALFSEPAPPPRRPPSLFLLPPPRPALLCPPPPCPLVRECAAAYERLDFTGACEAALAISRYCNKWVDVEAPWTLYKNGEKEKADAVIVAVLESVRVVAILLSPVVPLLASRVCAQLGYTPEQFASLRWDEAKWGFLKTGMQMPQPAPVFQRIEMPVAEGEEAAPAPAAAAGGKKKAAKQ